MMVRLENQQNYCLQNLESTEVTENGNRMFGLRGSFGAGDLDRI